MPVTPDKPGPYAPASAILEVVNRYRNKGLPSPIDAEVLGRVGVSDSLIPRTLQALQALDLIDEDGRPTDVLEGIRLAPEAEFQQRLRDWLTSAYAEALQFVDPATADETSIRDAFRGYNPVGQQPRMVTLFSGLFRAAGVGPEKPVPAARKAKSVTASPKAGKLKVTGYPAKARVNSNSRANSLGSSDLPPALAGLLASLPKQGESWTTSEHDAFVNTFQSVLVFCYPPKPDAEASYDAEKTEGSEQTKENPRGVIPRAPGPRRSFDLL